MRTKPKKPLIPHRWSCIRVVCILTVLGSPVLAGFSGSDKLTSGSSNWKELFPGSDRDRLLFQNSRLEYLYRSRYSNTRWAYLQWTPNKGSYQEDWFVQVHVNAGRKGAISIGVVDSKDRRKGYVVSIDRHSSENHRGFRANTIKGHEYEFSANSATEGVLRIHFDSKAKTLTGSWKTRLDWHYFPPVPISRWEMDATSKFKAVLIGGGTSDEDDDDDFHRLSSVRSLDSYDPYFHHFSCGPAAPGINVEQPAFSDLVDGSSKRSFGAAVVGNTGITRIFTIRNNGTARLAILKITKGGSNPKDFIVGKPGKQELAPGESTTFRVLFKPHAAGTRRALLHITSNQPAASPFDIAVTGMGVDESNARLRQDE